MMREGIRKNCIVLHWMVWGVDSTLWRANLRPIHPSHSFPPLTLPNFCIIITIEIRDERFYRSDVVSRILSLFCKYCISRNAVCWIYALFRLFLYIVYISRYWSSMLVCWSPSDAAEERSSAFSQILFLIHSHFQLKVMLQNVYCDFVGVDL